MCVYMGCKEVGSYCEEVGCHCEEIGCCSTHVSCSVFMFVGCYVIKGGLGGGEENG